MLLYKDFVLLYDFLEEDKLCDWSKFKVLKKELVAEVPGLLPFLMTEAFRESLKESVLNYVREKMENLSE